MKIKQCFAVGFIMLVCAVFGCVPSGQSDIFAGLEDLLSTAEPISTFDGDWVSDKYSFAMKITNRTGMMTNANPGSRRVGDVILVIVSVDGLAFQGRYVFSDGVIKNVAGQLTNKDTLFLAGNGLTWTMRRGVPVTQGKCTLTVSIQGLGQVSPNSCTYDPNTQLTWTATPDEGWRFDHWAGDWTGGPFDHWQDPNLEPANPRTIVIRSDMIVTAVFTPRRTDTATFDLGGGVTLKVVHIPGGTFTMGSSQDEQDRFAAGTMNYGNESPLHSVTISPFAMGETEVTQAQFRAVMGYVPDIPGTCRSDCFVIPLNDDSPAAWVSWTEATAFCDALGAKVGRVCRLPTEAEWEYACRAGTATAFSFGDSADDLGNYAWWMDNSAGAGCPGGQLGGRCMHRVANRLPNPWGLYDMHGNVWEWVGDWFGAYSAEAQTDPTGPKASSKTHGHKIVRGGAFQRFPWALRSAYRYSVGPQAQFNFGFRIVCE